MSFNSDDVLVFFIIACLIGLLSLIFVSTGSRPTKVSSFPSQQQKTEYMQLCADEGISAFNCLNNWMGVSNHGSN